MKTGKVSDKLLVTLLFFAALALLSGLYAGIIRLGWVGIFSSRSISSLAHGPLMINGFLGTLIGLERAAALDKKWAYLAPILMAASTIFLLFGPVLPAQGLYLLGSLGLTFVMAYLYYLQPKIYHLIMALGAASLFIGNAFYWAHEPIFTFVGWWAAFPMLTIFGERLELNRIIRPPKRAQQVFAGLIFGWILALIIISLDRSTGWSIASLLLMAIAGWLIRYDIARRTIKSIEWTQYSALCLLTGYGWLILSGLFGLWYGFTTAGPLYDGLLHMIFVGFVFSMIFAHASVIIPSLSGKIVPWSSYFYLPLVLLHGFLITRLIGDIIWLPLVRKIGAYGNVAAIILFLGGVLFGIIRRN